MTHTTPARLSMSESEICASYRAARSKKAQIRILADLNACQPERILQVLTSNGYANPLLPDTALPSADTTVKGKFVRISATEREPELRRLLDEGRSAIEIALYWNVSANRVHVLMRKFGLSVVSQKMKQSTVPSCEPPKPQTATTEIVPNTPQRPPLPERLPLVNIAKDSLNDALHDL